MSEPTHVAVVYLRRKRIFQAWKKCFCAVYLSARGATRAAGRIEVYPSSKDWVRAKRGRLVQLSGCVAVRTVATGLSSPLKLAVTVTFVNCKAIKLGVQSQNEAWMLEDAVNRAAFPDSYHLEQLDKHSSPSADGEYAPWEVETFRVQLVANASSKRLGLSAPAHYDLELCQQTIQLRDIGGGDKGQIVLDAWSYDAICWFSYGYQCVAMGTDESGTCIEMLTRRPERLYERLRLRIQLWPDAEHSARPDGAQLQLAYYGGYRVVRPRHFGEHVQSPAQYAPRSLASRAASSSCGRASSIGSLHYESDADEYDDGGRSTHSASVSNAHGRHRRRRRARSAFARLLRRRSRVDDHFEWPQFDNEPTDGQMEGPDAEVPVQQANDYCAQCEYAPQWDERNEFDEYDAVECELNGAEQYFYERPPSPPDILQPDYCGEMQPQPASEPVVTRSLVGVRAGNTVSSESRPFSGTTTWSEGPSVRLSQLAPTAHLHEIDVYNMQQEGTIAASEVVRSITGSRRNTSPMDRHRATRWERRSQAAAAAQCDAAVQTDLEPLYRASLKLNTFERQAQQATLLRLPVPPNEFMTTRNGEGDETLNEDTVHTRPNKLALMTDKKDTVKTKLETTV